jgi:hypothetical protein
MTARTPSVPDVPFYRSPAVLDEVAKQTATRDAFNAELIELVNSRSFLAGEIGKIDDRIREIQELRGALPLAPSTENVVVSTQSLPAAPSVADTTTSTSTQAPAQETPTVTAAPAPVQEPAPAAPSASAPEPAPVVVSEPAPAAAPTTPLPAASTQQQTATSVPASAETKKFSLKGAVQPAFDHPWGALLGLLGGVIAVGLLWTVISVIPNVSPLAIAFAVILTIVFVIGGIVAGVAAAESYHHKHAGEPDVPAHGPVVQAQTPVPTP